MSKRALVLGALLAACTQTPPQEQPMFPKRVPPPDPTFDDAARGYPGACRGMCTSLRRTVTVAGDICTKDPTACADYQLYIRALQRLMIECPPCRLESGG